MSHSGKASKTVSLKSMQRLADLPDYKAGPVLLTVPLPKWVDSVRVLARNPIGTSLRS